MRIEDFEFWSSEVYGLVAWRTAERQGQGMPTRFWWAIIDEVLTTQSGWAFGELREVDERTCRARFGAAHAAFMTDRAPGPSIPLATHNCRAHGGRHPGAQDWCHNCGMDFTEDILRNHVCQEWPACVRCPRCATHKKGCRSRENVERLAMGAADWAERESRPRPRCTDVFNPRYRLPRLSE